MYRQGFNLQGTAMIITTVPIKVPKNNPNYGIITMSLLCKLIGEKLGIDSYLGINIPVVKQNTNFELSSHIEPFVSSIKQLEAMPSHLITDLNGVSTISSNLDKLYDKRYLIEKTVPIISCPCGRVDSKYAEDVKVDFIKDGRCIFCHEKPSIEDTKSLLLKIPERSIEDNVIPSKLNKEFREMKTKIYSQELLISKNRDTGIHYMGYNIDQDMLNHTWLNNFADDVRIMVSSPHVIHQSVLMDEVAHLLNPSGITYHLVMSYITGIPQIEQIKSGITLDKQLYMLESISTSSKTKQWQNSFIENFLNRDNKEREKARLMEHYRGQWTSDIINSDSFYRDFNRQYTLNLKLRTR